MEGRINMKELMKEIKYLDLFQIDINKYNQEMDEKRNAAKMKLNLKDYNKLLLDEVKGEYLRHHRDIDFSLSNEQMQKLLKDKIFWYPEERFENISSHAHFFLKTYENDMPVCVSTDSILHAFHLSISSILGELEEQGLFMVLIQMLENVMVNIESIKKKSLELKDEQICSLIKKAQIYYTVAYRLLSKNMTDPETDRGEGEEDFGEPGNDEDYEGYTEEESDGIGDVENAEEGMDVKKNEEAVDDNREELEEDENTENKSHDENNKNVNMNQNSGYDYEQRKNDNPIDRIDDILNIIKKDITDEVEYYMYLTLIESQNVSVFITIFQKKLEMDFSFFKPRGRYTANRRRRNLFQCLMWLSLIRFDLKLDIEGIWIMTKVLYECQGEISVDPLKIIKDMYEMLAGEPSRCDIFDVYQIAKELGFKSYKLTNEEQEQFRNTIIQKNKDRAAKFEFMQGMANGILLQCIYNNISLLDPEEKKKLETVSFLVQTQTPDTWIMYRITSSKPTFPRRRISSYDVIYALMNNTSVIDIITSRIKGVNEDFMKFRDGLNYLPKLDSCRKLIQESMKNEPEKWRRSIFSHWVFLLSRLSWVSNYPLNESLYAKNSWYQKVSMTQLGSYCDLRHDLLLSVEQAVCEGGSCSHPEVYVEPNLEFWTEFRRFINSMSDTIKKFEDATNQFFKLHKNSSIFYEQNGCLSYFNSSLEMFEQVVEHQINNKPLPSQLAKKLGGIVYFNYDQYCTFYHSGWYLRLFGDMEHRKAFNFKPEIADIYTDQCDALMEDEGCVIHLGNKKPRVGVMLIENSIAKTKKMFLTYGYNPEEIYKPLGIRMTNEEWEIELRKPDTKKRDSVCLHSIQITKVLPNPYEEREAQKKANNIKVTDDMDQEQKNKHY